jgi:hypothetical protein
VWHGPVIFGCWLIAAACACAAGCQPRQAFSEQEKQDIHDSWNPGSSRAVVTPQSSVLIEGPAPLLYPAQQAGTIHVTDSGSGAWLATASVARGTVIRIDAEDGIFAGERRVRPGPLTAGHRYGIVLDLNQGTDWQSRVEAPKPKPPPASRPADSRIEAPF